MRKKAELLEKICEVLKERQVLFAYLFGSFARNEFRKDSDVDIAVYVKDYKKLPLNFERRLSLKIEKRIGREVDIIVINDKPLSILSEILKHGKVIFSRDERERVRFETFMLGEIQYYNEVMKVFDEARLKKYGIR